MIIHSGDESNSRDRYQNEQECLFFIDWYKDIKVKYKIFVAGNHSTAIECRLIKKQQFTDAGIIYLENESINIEGINIFGSPYTPSFCNWSFMKSRDKMHNIWENIPLDIDILITHGPPKGILDLSENREHELEQCGCLSLYKHVMKIEPKICAFGHIHQYKGCYNNGTMTISERKTIFSNASCVEDGRFDKGLISHGNILEI